MIKTVGLIGIGKVGRTLFKFLTQNQTPELKLIWVVSKHISCSINNFMINNIQIFEKIEEISILPDAIIIATRDAEISNISNKLSEIFKHKLEDKYIFHLSGALTSKELEDCENYGAVTIAAHPFQTFFNEDPNCMNNIPWGIDYCYNSNSSATNRNQMTIQNFIKKLNGNPVFLNSQTVANKANYHAASVAASNFTTAAISFAAELSRMCGINAEEFLPAIITQTAANNINFILEQEKLDINNKCNIPLTGPVARGDVETIEKHLEALSKHEEIQNIYKNFSSALLKLFEYFTSTSSNTGADNINNNTSTNIETNNKIKKIKELLR